MEEEGKRKRDEENIQRGEEKRKREEGYTCVEKHGKTWKNCVEKLQDCVAKLLDENKTILTEKNKALHEKAKAVEERNIALDVNTKAVQEKSKLEEENIKMRMLVADLQGAVECPVCLVVPREGPVPCCPHGHITCSPCLATESPKLASITSSAWGAVQLFIYTILCGNFSRSRIIPLAIG